MTQNAEKSLSPLWWDADVLARRLPFLRVRQQVITAVRDFFIARDFLEVDTPALQRSPGLEPHLKAFQTVLEDPDGRQRTFYLHTSPEFAMKKLLAAGIPRLFQMARVFRNGERSDTHHPEFTMLEWYRAHAGYRDLMDDVEGLFRAVGIDRPARRMTVQDAFLCHAGVDLLATVPDPSDPSPPPDLLRQEARRIGVYTGNEDRWDDVFFHIFLDRIEPVLGRDGPLILHDWPASMAALSRRSASDSRICERFEVYLDGVELANAFGELTDAEEQRRRFEHDMDLKERLYGIRYPIDEAFLQAVARMPECAGIALGIDRLVMAVAGANRLTDVLWSEVE